MNENVDWEDQPKDNIQIWITRDSNFSDFSLSTIKPHWELDPKRLKGGLWCFGPLNGLIEVSPRLAKRCFDKISKRVLAGGPEAIEKGWLYLGASWGLCPDYYRDYDYEVK